jgi:hypothetical protein
MSDWREAYDDLHETLMAAQAERGQRREWRADGEIGCARYEREVMADRVNLLRARRGLGPVSIEEIGRKERLAIGHVDYTSKFAIGCADLATDREQEAS